MSKGMEWLLSLEDKVSSPAKSAEKRLGALEKRMKELAKAEKEENDPALKKRIASRLQSLALEKIESQIAVQTAKQEEHAGRWVERLDHGVHLVETLAEGARKVAEQMYEWGSAVVDASGKKQQEFLSFRTLLGDADKAKRLMEQLDETSRKTVFSEDEASAIGRKLIAGGIAAGDVPTYLRAIGDAAAATGASTEQVDTAVRALQRINAEGKLGSESMRALLNVGVDSGEVYKILAKDLHVTTAEARELVKAGKVNANEGLWAIVGGVATQRSSGMLGSAGEAAVGESSTRLLGKIREKWEGAFEDLWDTKGFSKWMGFLGNMNRALDGSTKSGRALKEAVGSAFDHLLTGVFGDLSSPEGLPGVEKLVTSISGAIDGLGYAAGGLAKGLLKNLDPTLTSLASGPMDEAKAKILSAEFEKLGNSIGKSAQGAAKLLGLVGKLMELGGEGVDWLGKTAYAYQRGKGALEQDKMTIRDPVTGEELSPAAIDQLADYYGKYQPMSIPPPIPEATAGAIASQKNSATYSPSIQQTIQINGPADASVVREAAKQGAQQGAQMSTVEDLAFACGGID